MKLKGNLLKVSNSTATKNYRDVVYPPVGIAHITDDLSDLVSNRMVGCSSITLHSSAQPNSFPHLGTVTTIMTAFALGQHFKKSFGVPVTIRFEFDNNSPTEQKCVEGVVYSRMLTQCSVGKVRRDKYFIKEFTNLFDFLVSRSSVSYEARPFDEFQALPFVRENLIFILRNSWSFLYVVSPSERRFHLRFPCPKCGFSDKSGRTLKIYDFGSYVMLQSTCAEHGEFDLQLKSGDKTFIDFNTPLMDILQAAQFIHEDSEKKSLSIMLDGGDWAGVWVSNVLYQGLSLLGFKYEHMPLHFYAPIIEDWSGAKFSKSMYVEGNSYEYLPKEYLNLYEFRKKFGEVGMDVLWEECVSWVSNPKKFFRNYTIEYFTKVFCQNKLI